MREGVGLFDQSSFAKFLLQGRDAERVLNRVSANDVAVVPGRVVYTQWLNERGGIEADLTVTRLAHERFLVVTAAAGQTRDFAWLSRHIPDDAHAVLTDVTSGYAVLGIMGPKARALLSALSPDDLSNQGFPDVLVAPVLLVGNAPYHMGFAGTMTLPPILIQEVYFEAAKSLMQHGFKRFLIYNGHGGNRVITQFIVDRINHETPGVCGRFDQSHRRTGYRLLPFSVWGILWESEGIAERPQLYREKSLLRLPSRAR